MCQGVIPGGKGKAITHDPPIPLRMEKAKCILVSTTKRSR
jgi:hypothetical protein